MRRLLGVVGEPMNGVGYVRFEQPIRHLRDRGFELVTLGEQITLERTAEGYRPAPSLLDGIDAVVFPQMVASPQLADGMRLDLVGPICAQAVERGLPVIYSVDDDVGAVEESNPAFERMREFGDNVETILAHASAVFVTTDGLRRQFAGRGLPVFVLPNAIDPGRWRPRRRVADELHIGWAGSSSHVDDLLMVLPAIRRLQRRVDCRFVLQGLVARPLAEEAADVRGLLPQLSGSRRERASRFLELAGSLAELRHRHVPYTEMARYFEVLSGLDLDVGICPLRDTPFNRRKSALKFYEYAMCETLTVASAIPPYRDEVSITVRNEPDAWCDALQHWLPDRDRREVELARQRAFVLEQRDIGSMRHRWAEALEATLGGACAAVSAGSASSRRSTE